MASPDDVIAALARWEANREGLIGLFESQNLEFKMTNYRFQEASQKAEFAKDIVAMANSGGGLIVVGVETASDDATGRDRSVRVRPLPIGSVDESRMENVARTWAYPPIRTLSIRQWPDSGGQEMLLSIRVPPLPDAGGLAVVLGPGDPPDRRTVGVPIRSGSRTDFHNAAEIYEWVRRGRLQFTPAPPSGLNARRDADAQLDRLGTEFVETAAAHGPIFFVQSWSPTPSRLTGMHDHDGVRAMFLNPPPHRANGFNWWGLQPKVDVSGGIRASSGRLALWITPTGVATLVLGEEPLTWAMKQHDEPGSHLLINPTVLGEFVFEFCRLNWLLAAMLKPPSSSAIFRFGLLAGKTPVPIRLARGKPGPADPFYGYGAVPAPSDEVVEDPFEIDQLSEPGIVAAHILRRVYDRFGLGRGDIPYLVDDGTRFDPDGIGEAG